MDFSELKELDSRDEMISLVQKGALHGGDIWQTLDFEEKGNHLSKISEIVHDEKNHKIVLKLSAWVSLNMQKAIYVRLNYRRAIFKVPIGKFMVIGNEVICDYPTEAHALEERGGGERYVLLPSAELSLSLKRAERTVRETTYEMEVRIIDVSEKGFGVQISSQNREYFKEHDHFWLRAVNHKELRAPILGTVCYVSSSENNPKRGEVRVGLSLSFPLDHEVLEQLKRECMLVLGA